MKSRTYILTVVACALIGLGTYLTGCVHTPYVTSSTDTNGVVTLKTNIVTTIDPAKLKKVQDLAEPTLARVLARVIHNSPDHAVEIANYARSVGTAFYFVKSSGRFSPGEVLVIVDAATQRFQSDAPQELIDAKDAILAAYNFFFDDQLTVTVPNNGWIMAVCDTLATTIDRALKESGQPGVTQ